MMKIKNKKGDIPITILVIGVFAVCGLAILSFLNSTIQIKNSFFGIDLMEKINLQIEEYAINKNLTNLDVKIENGEKFLYQERNITKLSPELGFHWLKEKSMFSVKYNFPLK